jgi:hypothetical protein
LPAGIGNYRVDQVARHQLEYSPAAGISVPLFAHEVIMTPASARAAMPYEWGLNTLFSDSVGAVRQGLVSAAYFYQGETEPESSAKRARHFINLFEAPVLFYVVCLAAMITHFTGIAMQVLAWIYVAARLVHAYVHLGGNRLRHRMRAYFFSWGVLLAMWLYLIAGVTMSRI